jgi:hypothetical protein
MNWFIIGLLASFYTWGAVGYLMGYHYAGRLRRIEWVQSFFWIGAMFVSIGWWVASSEMANLKIQEEAEAAKDKAA